MGKRKMKKEKYDDLHSSQRQKATVIWDNEGRAHDGRKDGCAVHA